MRNILAIAGKELRGYKRADMPAEWKVEDGALVLRGKGGDIVTKGEYGDFEFTVDWKVAPGGNSEIGRASCRERV